MNYKYTKTVEQTAIAKEKHQQVLFDRRFQCKGGKPYIRQQRNNIKRRKTAQKNN